MRFPISFIKQIIEWTPYRIGPTYSASLVLDPQHCNCYAACYSFAFPRGCTAPVIHRAAADTPWCEKWSCSKPNQCRCMKIDLIVRTTCITNTVTCRHRNPILLRKANVKSRTKVLKRPNLHRI